MLHGSDGNKENKNFRTISPKFLSQIERDMLNGVFVFTGSTIVVDEYDYVRDGQKRLQGCINSGRPFDTIVVRGVPEANELFMDNGQRRTLAQHLRKANEANYCSLSSAITTLWKINEGKEMMSETPSTDVALDVLRTNPGLRDSVQVAVQTAKKFFFPEGPAAAIHYVTAKWNRSAADKFWASYATGADLGENDPINRLRQRMISNSRSKEKLPTTEKIALAILAWNLWSVGRECRCLKWTGIGPSATRYPRIEIPAAK